MTLLHFRFYSVLGSLSMEMNFLDLIASAAICLGFFLRVANAAGNHFSLVVWKELFSKKYCKFTSFFSIQILITATPTHAKIMEHALMELLLSHATVLMDGLERPAKRVMIILNSFSFDSKNATIQPLKNLSKNLFSDVNECESEPCQNGATCVDGINAYTCECVKGYTGHDCEKGTF